MCLSKYQGFWCGHTWTLKRSIHEARWVLKGSWVFALARVEFVLSIRIETKIATNLLWSIWCSVIVKFDWRGLCPSSSRNLKYQRIRALSIPGKNLNLIMAVRYFELIVENLLKSVGNHFQRISNLINLILFFRKLNDLQLQHSVLWVDQHSQTKSLWLSWSLSNSSLQFSTCHR